jgi:hypothetical protein
VQDKKKCQHPTCGCPALMPLSDYCCEGCKVAAEREAAGETPMVECMCQHPDCGTVPEVPVETQGLAMASELLSTS